MASDVDNPSYKLTTFAKVNNRPLITRNIIPLTSKGVYDISYFSRDPAGNSEALKSLVIKTDETPPRITSAASPTTLSPPNNKFVPVHVTGRVTDNLSGVSSTVTYHVIDEYGQVEPSGTASVNSRGNYSFVTDLQASRSGQEKDGRQYIIDVTTSDLAGIQSNAYDIATVPHDQNKQSGSTKPKKVPVVVIKTPVITVHINPGKSGVSHGNGNKN